MTSIAKTIGHRIRAYRKDQGLSIESLAEKAGIHPSYIGQIERGGRNASIEVLYQICQALGISLSQLVEVFDMDDNANTVAFKCYEAIIERPLSEQKNIQEIIYSIIEFKDLP